MQKFKETGRRIPLAIHLLLEPVDEMRSWLVLYSMYKIRMKYTVYTYKSE